MWESNHRDGSTGHKNSICYFRQCLPLPIIATHPLTIIISTMEYLCWTFNE